MIYALAGNPNCGKSTLFNALTGAHRAVGNWSGVTVDAAYANIRGIADARMIDLPGAYSLTPSSLEEAAARDFLLSDQTDVIINVVDITNPHRNLVLTLALARLGKPMVLAANMADELARAGGHIDVSALSDALGIPVVSVSGRSGAGLGALREAMAKARPPKGAIRAIAEADGESAIERLLTDARYHPGARDRRALTDRIDDWLLHPLFAYPAMAFIAALMFYMAFGPLGALLSGGMQLIMNGVEQAAALLMRIARAPDWASGLVLGGAVAGVGGVLTFLPQLVALFLFMAVLEDSGYMARAAFLADRPLRRFGLSGRCVIPLIMGFGCTTVAITSTQGLENKRDQRMTALLTPFMSCGARIPVYALFTAAFFPRCRELIVFLLYLTGALFMLMCAYGLRKTVFLEGEAVFVMELPPYRMPTLKSVMKKLSIQTLDFLRRAGTLILSASVITWLAQYFTPAFSRAPSLADSIFGRLGALMAPFFTPLGFGTREASVSLLSGIIAKEAVVSTLQILYAAKNPSELIAGVSKGFVSPAAALSYLAFVLLYTPCVSAVAAMRRAIGAKDTLRAIAAQLSLAYGAAFLVYRVGRVFLC